MQSVHTTAASSQDDEEIIDGDSKLEDSNAKHFSTYSKLITTGKSDMREHPTTMEHVLRRLDTVHIVIFERNVVSQYDVLVMIRNTMF